jgi:hypothetical protein
MNNKAKDFLQQHNKLILIILITVIVLVFLIILSINKLNQDNNKLVDIQVSFRPENTNITIDNKNVVNGTTIKLAIGEHQLKASLNGYEEYSKTITISEYSKNIFDILIPLNQDDLDAYYTQYHSFLSQQIQIENETIVNLYPIADYLPYNNNLPFSYDYNVSDDYLKFTIVVTPQYTINYGDLNTIYNTLSHINGESGRYDLSQYNIEILTFENPFTEFKDSNIEDPLEYIKNGYSEHENFSHMEFINGQEEEGYYFTAINNCNPEQPMVCDRYKVLLQQKDSGWTLLGKPEAILNKHNTDPLVPQYVLYDANNYRLR